MKEIGGYFGLEQLINNEYYKDLIPLNNGRNALLFLLKARKIKKLYIPYYLCDSVSNICIRYGYEFEYYSISADFMPLFNRALDIDEYLYVVNYYGQLTDERIIYLKHNFGQIIVDNAHAFFHKPLAKIDTIYSCRKFFGVPDGAYLSTEVNINEYFDTDVSRERMAHLLGRFEGNASDYYSYFKKNDDSFNNEPLKYMSKITHNILGAINYENVRQTRNMNFGFLHDELNGINKIRLSIPDGPFAYPFYVENGIEIRKVLANKRLYVPTLWPNVLGNAPESSVDNDYAKNILPLPCDQRYDMDDMKFLIGELRKCIY